jgi:hypothetical protein
MKTCENNSADENSQVWRTARQPASRPSRLHLVTVHELRNLREELAKGNIPPDLEAKLTKLALGDLAQRSIEQNCRTIIALLQAAQGSFKEASQEACERLLRVLAYVRKDDDAIPDYRPTGFADDQQEMRAVIIQLNPLLHVFKAWRLRHQVPEMWFGRQHQEITARS